MRMNTNPQESLRSSWGLRRPTTHHSPFTTYNTVMDEPQYDPRYLAGIVLFNRGDFFEAHEVWESLWMDEYGPERKFYQALIQAAVGLLHFCNGNVRGAAKLYRSSRDYMQRYASPFLGLDQDVFWCQMERCFA